MTAPRSRDRAAFAGRRLAVATSMPPSPLGDVRLRALETR